MRWLAFPHDLASVPLADVECYTRRVFIRFLARDDIVVPSAARGGTSARGSTAPAARQRSARTSPCCRRRTAPRPAKGVSGAAPSQGLTPRAKSVVELAVSEVISFDSSVVMDK